MEILKKVKESKEKLNDKFKLSSLIIDKRKGELVINFHNNEENYVRSFTFINNELKAQEDLKEGFRALKNEDEIKENELKELENLLEDKKHYVVSKEKGELFLLEMDFENQEIKKYNIKNRKKEIKEKYKFDDIIKMRLN